uniref:Parathymosin n=1 Tax=Monopterus albus TaxID=43700 RepID=A0A3Q3INF8_MONAL
MADTAADTNATAEVTAKELKEKKEVDVAEEKTDHGDAPANGTAEEVPPAEETDAQPVKRAAEEEEEEEEKVETKKPKTEENGGAKEADVEA